MITYKQKKNITTIAIVVIVAVVLTLVVSLFAGNSKKNDEYTKIRGLGWVVGGIDENGRIDKDVTSSMVSDRIEIKDGFKIEPEFNELVTYKLYYYDESDVFIGNPEGEEFSNIVELTFEEIVEEKTTAKYVRIVLIPDDNDGEIGRLEKLECTLYEAWL